MDDLGGYHELAPASRLLGAAVFLVALCLVGFLERLQFRLRATESSTWWASNGRDVLNAIAVVTMTLGLKVVGLTGPVSMAIAASLVLVVSVLQSALGERRYATGLSVLFAVALGAPVLIAPGPVHDLFQTTLLYLFQG